MKLTGFINNTNVLEDTTPEDVFEGEKIIKEVEKRTGIPLVMTSVMESLMTEEELKKIEAPEVMMMQRTIKYAY